MAFAPASLILANNNLPINRALYAKDASLKYSLLLILLLTSCASIKNPVSPIEIGVWDLVADYCDESYEFKIDGTIKFVSSPEMTIDNYTLTKVGNDGFYEWSYEVIKYNNKPSCNGTFDTYLGQKTTTYVKFSDDLSVMRIYFYPHEGTYIGAYLKRRE